MLKLFRYLSLLEGVSLLAILSVTLGLISRDFVMFIGMAHGVLFMSYIIFALVVVSKMKWHILMWAAFIATGFIPFAFIPVEVYLKNKIDEQTAKPEPVD